MVLNRGVFHRTPYPDASAPSSRSATAAFNVAAVAGWGGRARGACCGRRLVPVFGEAQRAGGRPGGRYRARAAFAAAGVTVEFKTMPYARCMQAVRQGVELGCFDTLKDASTRDDYLFHEQPLFKATIAIYAPAAFAGSVNAQQLAGHSVGLTNGYTYGDTIEKNPAIRKDMAPNDFLTLRKLVAGRTEFALVYTRVADWLLLQYPELRGGFRQAGVLLEDGLYLQLRGTRSDAPEAVRQLNRGWRRSVPTVPTHASKLTGSGVLRSGRSLAASVPANANSVG